MDFIYIIFLDLLICLFFFIVKVVCVFSKKEIFGIGIMKFSLRVLGVLSIFF